MNGATMRSNAGLTSRNSISNCSSVPGSISFLVAKLPTGLAQDFQRLSQIGPDIAGAVGRWRLILLRKHFRGKLVAVRLQ